MFMFSLVEDNFVRGCPFLFLHATLENNTG